MPKHLYLSNGTGIKKARAWRAWVFLAFDQHHQLRSESWRWNQSLGLQTPGWTPPGECHRFGSRYKRCVFFTSILRCFNLGDHVFPARGHSCEKTLPSLILQRIFVLPGPLVHESRGGSWKSLGPPTGWPPSSGGGSSTAPFASSPSFSKSSCQDHNRGVGRRWKKNRTKLTVSSPETTLCRLREFWIRYVASWLFPNQSPASFYTKEGLNSWPLGTTSVCNMNTKAFFLVEQPWCHSEKLHQPDLFVLCR